MASPKLYLDIGRLKENGDEMVTMCQNMWMFGQ